VQQVRARCGCRSRAGDADRHGRSPVFPGRALFEMIPLMRNYREKDPVDPV